MIQPQTIVRVTDNSGAKTARVFKILGATRKKYARIGDLVTIAVQTAEPRKAVKKKQVLHAVVVRQVKPFRRKDGSYIKFDENAVVIVDKKKGEINATRVFGPIPREIDSTIFKKIVSLAPEVV